MKGKKFGVQVEASVARVMAEKLDRGAAIDVGAFDRVGRYYVLPRAIINERQDYLDFARRTWIRTIGLVTTATGIPIDGGKATAHVEPGTVLAAEGQDFTNMPGVQCIWQR